VSVYNAAIISSYLRGHRIQVVVICCKPLNRCQVVTMAAALVLNETILKLFQVFCHSLYALMMVVLSVRKSLGSSCQSVERAPKQWRLVVATYLWGLHVT
jgi:hypothetical protein